MDHPTSMQTSWTTYWMVVVLQVPNLLLWMDMEELFCWMLWKIDLGAFHHMLSTLHNSQAIIPWLEINFREKVMRGDWRVTYLLQQFVVVNLFTWIPYHLLSRSSRIALSILPFCLDHLWLRVALLPRFLSSYRRPTLILFHRLAFYFSLIQWT